MDDFFHSSVVEMRWDGNEIDIFSQSVVILFKTVTFNRSEYK